MRFLHSVQSSAGGFLQKFSYFEILGLDISTEVLILSFKASIYVLIAKMESSRIFNGREHDG